MSAAVNVLEVMGSTVRDVEETRPVRLTAWQLEALAGDVIARRLRAVLRQLEARIEAPTESNV